MNPFSYTGVQLHQMQQLWHNQDPKVYFGLQYGQPQLAAEVATGMQYPQGGSVVSQQQDKNNNKTGYRGVRKRAWGMFAAEIRDGAANKRRWVGTYSSSELAAKAYDAAALVLHGSKAKTNFVYGPSTVEMYKVPKGDAAAAEAMLADIAAGRNLPVPEGQDQKCSSVADTFLHYTARQEPTAAAAVVAAPATANCYNTSWHSQSCSSSQEEYAPSSNAATPSANMQQQTVFGASADSCMAAAQLLLHADISWMLQMRTAAAVSAATAAAVAGQSYHAHASAADQAGVGFGNVTQIGSAGQVASLQHPSSADSTMQGLHTLNGAVAATAAAAATTASDKAVTACKMEPQEHLANVSSPIISCGSSSMVSHGAAGKHGQGGPVQLASVPAAAVRNLHVAATHIINHSSAEGSLHAQGCDAAEAAALPRLGSSGLSIQQAALAARLRASGSNLVAPGIPQLPSVATTALDCMRASPAGISALPQPVLQEQLQQHCETVATDHAIQMKQEQPQEDAAPLTADQAIAATALLGSLFKLGFKQRGRMLEGLISTGLFAGKQGGSSDMCMPGQPSRLADSKQLGTASTQQHVAVAASELLQQATTGCALYPTAAELGALADAAMQSEVGGVKLGAKRGLAGRESSGSEDSSGANGRAELPSAKRRKQLGACRAEAATAAGEAATAAGEAGVAGVPGAELAGQMALQALADMAAMLDAGNTNL